MSTTFPADEKILSYETLDLVLKTTENLTYRAPDSDFCAKIVILDRQLFEAAGHDIPERLIVALSYENLK